MTPSAVAPVSKPPPLKATEVIRLPSARRCASRRRFRIRLRRPRGVVLVSARIEVNGKRVAVLKGARLRSTVDLRGLPKGRFVVRIAVRTATGQILTGARRYRTCVRKQRGGRPGPL